MQYRDHISSRLKELQDDICRQIEQCDGKAKFQEDLWDRDGGGGGRTRIIQNGNVLEKAGVNFSAVHGSLPETIAREFKMEGNPSFFATGVSIVMHPNNPWVPIIHMNVRYFEINDSIWWFGGGIDLTPHYIHEDQAKYFHQQLKAVVGNHNPDWYNEFKIWADNYFYIPHREETRGIGGIFFDQLNHRRGSRDELENFILDVGNSFAPIYTHLIQLNRSKNFGEKEKKWQLIRRGRYVEFNLVYDRGTRFGLETSGRIESILMSLPALASWEYNFIPEPGSPEEATLKLLKKGIDWTK